MAVTPANKVTGAARAAAPARTRTLWADAWGRLKRNKVAVAGAVILVVIALIAIIYACATILFAIVVVVALGPSLLNIYLAIGFTFWPPMARLVRSQVLSIREKEYVEAARAIGVSSWRVMFAHILPNTLGPVIVAATFGIPFAILTEAFLSFIGIGVQPPLPSWGAMIFDEIGR